MAINCYCVLAGGGVKALCFPGALEAAADAQIEFLGYAGASGGAIVAVLACVGYTPQEIRGIFKEFQLEELFEDLGPLDQVNAVMAHGRNAMASSGMGRAKHVWHGYRSFAPILQRLHEDEGLYNPQILRDKLLELINKKLSTDYGDVTFETLRDHELPELRIVASDLTRQRPVVFGDGTNGYGDSVINAVAASACFPIVFSPARVQNALRLVDGGLASNLPVFVFADKSHPVRSPTIAFDLESVEDPGGDVHAGDGVYGLPSMVSDLVSTALSAGDLILRTTQGQANVVPIQVPAGLKTFTTAFDESQAREAWMAGYTDASQFFVGWAPLRLPVAAGGELRQQVQARYGTESLVMPLLKALKLSVEDLTQAKDVRVSVMMPVDAKSRLVVFDFGYDGAPDFDRRLMTSAGITGAVFTSGKMTVGDFEEARNNPEEWGLTRGEVGKVPGDRRAVAAVPIRAWTAGAASRRLGEAEQMETIGTLAIDSSVPLAQTGWVDDADRFDLELAHHLVQWCEVLSKLFD